MAADVRTQARPGLHGHVAAPDLPEGRRPATRARGADLRADPDLPVRARLPSGSSIRISIEAPVGITGDFGFLFNPTPATNTVWHDQATSASGSSTRLPITSPSRLCRRAAACSRNRAARTQSRCPRMTRPGSGHPAPGRLAWRSRLWRCGWRAAASRAPTSWSRSGSRIATGRFPSKWLNYPGPPRANVLLPDRYNPHKRYPLLVLLHGLRRGLPWYAPAGATAVFDGFPGSS